MQISQLNPKYVCVFLFQTYRQNSPTLLIYLCRRGGWGGWVGGHFIGGIRGGGAKGHALRIMSIYPINICIVLCVWKCLWPRRELFLDFFFFFFFFFLRLSAMRSVMYADATPTPLWHRRFLKEKVSHSPPPPPQKNPRSAPALSPPLQWYVAK